MAAFCNLEKPFPGGKAPPSAHFGCNEPPRDGEGGEPKRPQCNSGYSVLFNEL